ncbi:hypothetical protein [Streptomyces sp. NEAU-YJ-81]|uniref:hypothetical protein n=1 Tax=Streptomyces sp. NEAU-YJ-81 TaxID=2820288 RepID=UPI001ABC233A|nr:hypothetical protein [Streptomyces sp. NEAU-YJ-81]MBO3682835.1 hypothetical protein [Streptomyces sp. NEAU-YJ-81]
MTMPTRTAAAEPAQKEVSQTRRTPPIATQHLAELAWNVFEDAGEDVLLPKETVTSQLHATESQFTRLKGYVRDHISMEKGKAFLSFRDGYLITTDPAKIAESVSWRLRRINTELRRLLSGWINPLGEDVADYEVLKMYQEEIGHMLRLSERMQSLSMSMPKPVGARKAKRSRRGTATTARTR